jgi:hypothetical protein
MIQKVIFTVVELMLMRFIATVKVSKSDGHGVGSGVVGYLEAGGCALDPQQGQPGKGRNSVRAVQPQCNNSVTRV